MAGKFTVAVSNEKGYEGVLAAPFNAGGKLDFISKNGIATDTEVAKAKTEAILTAAEDATSKANNAESNAIAAAKTETEKQVSAAKTELTTEINKKVNTSDYNIKVSSIESSIGSIETTINTLNNTYATDAEVAAAKTELTGAIATAKTAAIDEAKQYTNTQIGNIVQFNISVVDKLPTTNIQPNTIYLVPATDTEDKNVNDEFLYIDGKWEQIGTTAINLDDELKPITTKVDNNTASIDNLIKAFPTNNPTVSPASAKFTISDKTSLSYEVGSVINVTAKTVFTKSTYTPKYLSGQFNAEPVGTENYPFCSDAYSCTFSGEIFDSNAVVLTTTDTVNTYITEVKDFNVLKFSSYTTQSHIDYNAVKVENNNLVIYNNKGEAYQTSTTGSVYATDCIIIYGTLPIYGTTSNITTLTKQSTQLKHTQNTVEITLVAQTTTDNKQMILIPQEWCDTNGVSKIEQYDELFKVWNVVTTNFASLECTWEQDGSALSLPSNNYVSDSYLSPEKVLDTTKKYILLVNIGGNIGQRKLRITR